MNRLMAILIMVIIISSVSGCVVDAHYGYRHRHSTGVIVTNVPPPPPPVVVVRPVPPPPPPEVVIVKPIPSPPKVIVRSVPAPPPHRGNPSPGRRDLRR